MGTFQLELFWLNFFNLKVLALGTLGLNSWNMEFNGKTFKGVNGGTCLQGWGLKVWSACASSSTHAFEPELNKEGKQHT